MPYKTVNIDLKKLKRLYLEENKSVSEISRILKTTESTARRYLEKNNLLKRIFPEGKGEDEYTPFRWYFRITFKSQARTNHQKQLRKNVKKKLTLKYLKYLWKKQKGKCAYSGIDLKAYTFSESRYNKSIKEDVTYASLDRIDSKKGYEKGNVQYVAWPINYAKNDMSDKQMKDFIKLIRKNK